MTYLFAAYGVLWGVSFVLVVSMVLRQRRLSADLQLLRLLVDEEAHREDET